MNKRAIVALVLAVCLLAGTFLTFFQKDPAADLQTVIIEVGGKTFTKGEVQAQTEYMLDYYEYMYSMYGMPVDRTDATFVKMAQQDAIDSLVQSVVVEAKIAEKGFDQFSEEELAEIEETANTQYDSYAEFVKSYALADTELTGDELQAAIDEQMVAMGYGTREQMIENERMIRSQNKLVEDIIKDVTVTEDEIQSQYNFLMNNAKATYEEYPEAYGIDLTNGTTGMYYAPAGYRNVKHILVTFAEENQTLIDEINAEIAAKQTELNAEGADAEAINAQISELQLDLTTATEAAYAATQPTIEEIQAKLAAGETFESLITEYNQDPGMTADSTGYAVSAVSTNWVPEFTEASMALQAIGDVSEPVRSSYGIHLIQYASDIAEGEVGLENVREELTNELLIDKQNNTVNEALTQWVEDAKVKIYEKRL